MALVLCDARDRTQDFLLLNFNFGAVMSVTSGLYLDVPGSSTAPGTPLELFASNGAAPNQRWNLTGPQLVSGLTGDGGQLLCAAAC